MTLLISTLTLWHWSSEMQLVTRPWLWETHCRKLFTYSFQISNSKVTFPQSLQNFYSRYKNLVGSRRIQEIRSFEEKVKELQRKSEDELTSKYVVGLELKPGEAIAFFSPLAFHAGPTSFSLVLNSFLQIVDSDLSATFEAHAIVSETNVWVKLSALA